MHRFFFPVFFFGVFLSSCSKEKISLLTQEIDSHTDYGWRSIFFVNDSVGYLSGGSKYQIGVISKTNNGGKTWTTPDSVFPKVIYSSYFFNPAEGLIGGFDSYWGITNDSAKTFSVSTGDYDPVNGICFIDKMHGAKVGGEGYSPGFISYTSDGGNTWSKTSLPNNFRCVKFSDSITAFASGYGAIYKSTDAGKTFSPTEAHGDFFVAIDFPSSSVGYFAGYEGEILKTTDAGNSFDVVRKGNMAFNKREHFEAIDMWDENTGWVAGHDGAMYKTSDGGGQWKKVKTFTSVTLRTIHLFSATTGIVAGDDGRIFFFME